MVTVDIFIIGGGINGVGIARDAVGRGYSVMLAEKDDLASGTSSGSTKLIHGGLRYLEFFHFRLVRKALKERELLWALAPHIIKPVRFVLPHHKGLRPAWLLRLGLFIYDHLGGRDRLPTTRKLDLRRDAAGLSLKDDYRYAFEYSDCWVDDARLVVLNARDAADRGADIRTRTKVTHARRENGRWLVEIEDQLSGAQETVEARLLVNAAGPWVDIVLADALGENDVGNVRLVRGSHIVVPRLFDHDRPYIFQNEDDRIIFAIPYEDDFTVVGTTDREQTESLDKIAIDDSEVDYLCRMASIYFKQPVTADQVVWTYSAVRPLYADGASKAQEATRDYIVRTEGDAASGLLLNIFGGKITTYRKLAEVVMAEVEAGLGKRGANWTATACLPGGDFAIDYFDIEFAKLRQDYPFLGENQARRLWRSYGTMAREFLVSATTLSDLGEHFGADLYAAEVSYLMDREWAIDADDIVCRRTKLILRLSEDKRAMLERFMAARR